MRTLLKNNIGIVLSLVIVVSFSLVVVRAYGKESIPEDVQARIDMIEDAKERQDDNGEAYAQYLRDQKLIEEQTGALKEDGFAFGDNGLAAIDPLL